MSDRPDPTGTTVPESRSDRIVVVAFVLALMVPWVGLAVGIQPETSRLEARETTELPFIDGPALGDPTTFAQIDQFIADRFPFRTQAVRAFAFVDYGILGGSSNPDVIVGRDGWLFTATELHVVCGLTSAETLRGLDLAATDLRAAGMDLRLIVAPDKHAIYPERIVPGSGLAETCTDRQRAELQRGLRERPGTAVELWTDLAAARATEDVRPVYFAQDTHWTPFGALIAIRRLVQSIDPTVWDESDVWVDGTANYPTDLSRLMGLPHDEQMGQLLIRPGVAVVHSTIPTKVDLVGAAEISHFVVPSDIPAVEGHTLVIYDSFFATSQERIVPWFRDSVWVHFNDLLYFPKLVKDLPKFDRIVLERAERSVHNVHIDTLLGPLVKAARPPS